MGMHPSSNVYNLQKKYHVGTSYHFKNFTDPESERRCLILVSSRSRLWRHWKKHGKCTRTRTRNAIDEARLPVRG